ncbi:MAG: hypothetical protein ACKPCI_03070, partial [Dolichospermum sp.]
NNIPWKTWQIVSKYGNEVRVRKASDIPALDTASSLDKFTQLINLLNWSEEHSYTARFHEVKSKLDALKSGYNIDSSTTEVHIIIQHCCFETWALGNAEISNEYPLIRSSKVLSDFKTYYDVLVNDPEEMSCCPPGHTFSTKARFHKRYIKEYLKQFGLSYSNKNPKVVECKKYLDALKKRCESMNHLSSLKLLLDIWDSIETL